MTEVEEFLRIRGLDPTNMGGLGFVKDKGYGMLSFDQNWQVRWDHVEKFGFAVLTSAMIELLRPYGPFIEVGAGSGYWAYELNKAGIETVPTDPGRSKYSFGWWKSPFMKVAHIGGVAAVRRHPNHTLLTVWPDYLKPWPAATLKAYRGRYVVYVGEEDGGCTGDGPFHNLLETEFSLIASHDIPQFSGIYDRLYIYARGSMRELPRKLRPDLRTSGVANEAS